MIYKVVQVKDGRLHADIMTRDELKKAHEIVGFNGIAHHRKELQGQPILTGFCGPMWDGTKDGQPVIRYESTEAYARLSK